MDEKLLKKEIFSLVNHSNKIEVNDILNSEVLKNNFDKCISIIEENNIEMVSNLNCNCINYDNILDNSLTMFMQEICSIPALSSHQQKTLLELYKKNNDKKIKEILILSNMRLVLSIVFSYRSKFKECGLDMLDLIQEGSIGLSKAIDRFEIAKGNQLSTYATYLIFSQIQIAILNNQRSIRIPISRKLSINKLKKYQNDFFIKNGTYPSQKQCSLYFNVSEEEIKKLENDNMPIISLQSKIECDDNYLCDFEIVSDENIEENSLNKLMDKYYIEKILKRLTPREQVVFLLRMGMDYDGKAINNGLTLQEIADKFNVKRQRIGQINSDIKRKIKSIDEIKKYL